MFDFPINAVHIHLLLNHIPIVLSLFCPLVLLYGIWIRSKDVMNIALMGFFFTALIAVPVFLSGKAAIVRVSALPDIHIRALVWHEQFATLTFALLIVSGASSGIILYSERRSPSSKYRSHCIWLLYYSLLVLASASATGYLGGSIRHTEIHYTHVGFKNREMDLISENERI